MAKQWEGWGASRQHGSPPAYAPDANPFLQPHKAVPKKWGYHYPFGQ